MLSLLGAGDSLSLSPSDLLSHTLIKETRSTLFLLFWTKTSVPHTMWKIRVQSCGAIDNRVALMAQPGAYRAHCQLRICSFRSVRGSSCGLVSSQQAFYTKPVD